MHHSLAWTIMADTALRHHGRKWATNLQQHFKAYYPIVESLNCTSPMQSAVAEDDSTLDEPWWVWYLASYLLAKGESSALYISPVFADAPVNRQHTVTMTYQLRHNWM